MQYFVVFILLVVGIVFLSSLLSVLSYGECIIVSFMSLLTRHQAQCKKFISSELLD